FVLFTVAMVVLGQTWSVTRQTHRGSALFRGRARYPLLAVWMVWAGGSIWLESWGDEVSFGRGAQRYLLTAMRWRFGLPLACTIGYRLTRKRPRIGSGSRYSYTIWP